MKIPSEIFKIALSQTAGNLLPLKLRTRACRFFYNYNSKSNEGIDLICSYQPVHEIPKQQCKATPNSASKIYINLSYHLHMLFIISNRMAGCVQFLKPV